MRRILGVVAVCAVGASAWGQQVVPAFGPVNIGSGGVMDGNIVYDNSTNLRGVFINGRDRERGDSATLAGTDRSVTKISLLIHTNAGNVSADVQVRLYDGGDSGPDPGALLWASGVFPQMAISVGTNQYDFAVPNIPVGNEVTWTVEMLRVSGDPPEVVGPRFVAPPTVGTSMDYTWDHTSGAWVQQWFSSVGPGGNSFGAIITAIPEAPCPCACAFDTSTGFGVCDLIDFTTFAGLFATGDPCACDIDTSTGPGVCDLVDFTTFAGQFAVGCP